MANPLLEQFLAQKSEPVVAKPEVVDTLSDVQFQNLTEEINKIRETINQGGAVTMEEERLIVVWFRARRGRNFSVVKEKPVKAATVRKTPAKRAAAPKRPQLTTLELLGDL